jgi:hypothetical protein
MRQEKLQDLKKTTFLWPEMDIFILLAVFPPW